MANKPQVQLTGPQIVSAARQRIRNAAPFLYTSLCKLALLYSDEIRLPVKNEKGEIELRSTCAVTDTGILIVSPAWIMEQAATYPKYVLEIVAFMLAHETLHYVLRTCKRAAQLFGGRATTDADYMVANIAADLAINEIVSQLNLSADPNWAAAQKDMIGVWPEHYQLPSGLAFEAYWHLLDKKRPPAPKNGPKPTSGDCGSGAVGKPSEQEDAVVKKAGYSRHVKSEAEAEHIARGFANDVKKAAELNRGDVPAGLAVEVDVATDPPKVRWEEQVRRQVRTGILSAPGRDVSDYSRLNKKAAGLGFGLGVPFIPHHKAFVPTVAVILDTSGSMACNNALGLALVEIREVLKQVGGRLRFISVDCEVHGDEQINSFEELMQTVKGGGGTDMNPAFALVSDSLTNARSPFPRPSLVICATDGEISQVPDCGVPTIFLVINTNEPTWMRENHTWADIIHIDPSELASP
jgi:predicted metal-dependent peptidase